MTIIFKEKNTKLHLQTIRDNFDKGYIRDNHENIYLKSDFKWLKSPDNVFIGLHKLEEFYIIIKGVK